jgi:[protein-PII] uridylyltransferase
MVARTENDPGHADPVSRSESAREAAAAQLSDALAVLAAEQSPIPREAAIASIPAASRENSDLCQAGLRTRTTDRIAGGALVGRAGGRRGRWLFEHVLHDDAGLRRQPERLSVAATGGYGRGVLAPFSDIDLLFLTDEEPDAATLQAVEYMLYFLWDLGLKVGHATRSIEDCLTEGAKDTTIRTALLDARYV